MEEVKKIIGMLLCIEWQLEAEKKRRKLSETVDRYRWKLAVIREINTEIFNIKSELTGEDILNVVRTCVESRRLIERTIECEAVLVKRRFAETLYYKIESMIE